MFDVVCATCGGEFDKSSTSCLVCGGQTAVVPADPDFSTKLFATRRRMVSERCSSYTGRCCLLSSSDWAKPQCARCTAILLCDALGAAHAQLKVTQ